jgi:hypothetical protein
MNLTRKTNTSANEKQHLDRRDIYRVMKMHPGMEVSCEKGILWVTQSGDYRDYLLTPGQKIVLKKHGSVLIEAMRDVDFKLISPEKTRFN